jgi:hypothetical protein
MGHATMENRHGLAVAGMVTLATGTAERRASETMLKAKVKKLGRHITVGEGWSQRVDATLYPERERWSVRQCVEVIFEALRHQRKQSFGIAGRGASR